MSGLHCLTVKLLVGRPSTVVASFKPAHRSIPATIESAIDLHHLGPVARRS